MFPLLFVMEPVSSIRFPVIETLTSQSSLAEKKSFWTSTVSQCRLSQACKSLMTTFASLEIFSIWGTGVGLGVLPTLNGLLWGSHPSLALKVPTEKCQ